MPSLNSPILAGDVSGGLHSTSVDKLKGQPVASTAPSNGQVLTWDGTQWAPATNSSGGGGGANGLTYYLRQDVDADAPTTNLPGTPKQLGRTGATGQTSVTSGILTTGSWTLLGGYVSESVPIDPNITAIPGGLWDLNVWALGTANTNSPTVIRAKVYTYNGTDAPTLLATSGEQIINTVSAQYSVSVLVPQTTVQLTTRIYIEVEVKASANNHTATLQFGDGTPSHVHTSLPLVGGTGLWKNVSGVLQSPASLLVDADVDAAAAIAQSKIANLSTDLGNKAGTAVVDIYTTPGAFTWTKRAGAKAINVQLLAGGGGGGSGRRDPSTTAVKCGGGGGGGGSYLNVTMPAAAFGDTVSGSVGSGGTGGAAVIGTTANGNNGAAGGNSVFDGLIATGGNAGIGGTISSGTGGNAGLNSNAGAAASTGGGAGNVGSPIALTVAWNYGGAGGGAGGGVNGSNAPSGGGIGGRSVALGFAGGTAGIVGGAGGAGTSNTSAASGIIAVGAGAGGGGGSTTAGGAGGAGGFPSSGGGGGGAGATDSGAGGAGAAGMAVITTYF